VQPWISFSLWKNNGPRKPKMSYTVFYCYNLKQAQTWTSSVLPGLGLAYGSSQAEVRLPCLSPCRPLAVRTTAWNFEPTMPSSRYLMVKPVPSTAFKCLSWVFLFFCIIQYSKLLIIYVQIIFAHFLNKCWHVWTRFLTPFHACLSVCVIWDGLQKT
jgi:hypothetical protein